MGRLKRMWSLALLLAATASAAAADPQAVSLVTRDGNAVTGTIDLEGFKIETSLGRIEVKLADVAEVLYTDKSGSVRLWDGTTLLGKVDVVAWPLKSKLGDLLVKPENIARIACTRIVGPQTPRIPPQVTAGTAPAVPARAGREPDLKPVKTLPLKASVARLLLSADGSTLYALQAADAKLLVIPAETLTVVREVPIPPDPSPANSPQSPLPAFALVPGGKLLAAATRRTVALLDPATGRVTKTFPIEHEIVDLFAIDEQTLLATTTRDGLITVSVPRQAVMKRIGAGSGPMSQTRDGSRIYMQGGTLVLPAPRSLLAEPAFLPHADGGSFSNNARITADGRFAVSTSGSVFRLGRSCVADLLPCGRVLPHLASASTETPRVLLLFTADGFMKEIDLATLEVAKSTYLGVKGYRVLADEPRNVFYLSGPADNVAEGGYTPSPRAVPPAGDIHQFALPR